ncbi:hypothetical protein FSP39_015219 [Pinctada imbricata]|uniref:Uncharacterized protein n=1 Tax=Pinctada imbricata TaxID=66713 RepID=A0AA88YT74_PINIB|nr:hypothetical protein FSP39_015219 [Pinctada imbricata]
MLSPEESDRHSERTGGWGPVFSKAVWTGPVMESRRHSRSECKEMERRGFELISIDVQKGELILKHPGACVADFDIDYQPKVWVMMGWTFSARLFAHSQPIGQTKERTFLDNLQLTKDRLVFIRASEVIFTKAMYSSKIDKTPLFIKISGGYVGKTSVCSTAEVKSSSGELLITNTDRVITVDLVNRKPIPIPDWFRERNYRTYHEQPIIFMNVIRPYGVKHKKMRVHWSDLDFNVHATWYTYVLMTINAASLLVKDGQLRHFRENKSRGLYKLQLQFLGESVEGDELDVYVWEDTETYIMKCDVCRYGVSIFQGTFEAMERLGLELVSMNVENGEKIIKHPGASVTDFDIDCQPKIWVMMGWIFSARSFINAHQLNQTAGRQLAKEKLFFIRASEVEFTKAVYSSKTDRRPLYIKLSEGHIGNSSFSSIAEVTSPSGEILVKSSERIITVDLVTRKPSPIPDWYRQRKKHKQQGHPVHFEKFVRPLGVKHKNMRVHLSDLDFNAHATWSTYVMMTIETASLLVKEGQLRHFRENKLRGLHKVQLQFLGESVEGDELDVFVWMDSQTYIMRSDVCKNGESICQCSFEFFKD